MGLLQGDEGRDTKGDLVEELVKDHVPVKAGVVGVAIEEDEVTGEAAGPAQNDEDEDEDVVEV